MYCTFGICWICLYTSNNESISEMLSTSREHCTLLEMVYSMIVGLEMRHEVILKEAAMHGRKKKRRGGIKPYHSMNYKSTHLALTTSRHKD
jgi:hypothetical protein